MSECLSPLTDTKRERESGLSERAASWWLYGTVRYGTGSFGLGGSREGLPIGRDEPIRGEERWPAKMEELGEK